MRILVDAMGGDNAPLEILKGCKLAADEYGYDIILCGDEGRIRRILDENGLTSGKFAFADAPDAIEMTDHADAVVKEKKDSSMAVGLRLLQAGEGDAFVTAGNTGAALVGSSLILRRIKGIKRAAIATILPARNGTSMLIDCGANVECKAEYLNQFGLMGSLYVKAVLGIETPRVGLLNNGAEATKGAPLQVEAYKLLSENPYIHFIGNIEGRDGPLGAADVIVCDGFTGNVYLKTMEGMGQLILKSLKDILLANAKTKFGGLLLKSQIESFRRTFDYREYGGAPLLGIDGAVIKAHGSADAVTIKNALKQAASFAESGVNESLREAVFEIS